MYFNTYFFSALYPIDFVIIIIIHLLRIDVYIVLLVASLNLMLVKVK